MGVWVTEVVVKKLNNWFLFLGGGGVFCVCVNSEVLFSSWSQRSQDEKK